MPRVSPERQLIIDIEKELTGELKLLLPEALVAAGKVLGEPLDEGQLHARIGHWNNNLVDSVRDQFESADDFVARWFAGARDAISAEVNLEAAKHYKNPGKAIFRLGRLLQDPTVAKYTRLFLERTFYRTMEARRSSELRRGWANRKLQYSASPRAGDSLEWVILVPMGMAMGFVAISDRNIERVLADPPLLWKFIAPDDDEAYE